MWGFRADGDEVKDMPATRRIMPFIMQTRNESVVYFEQKVEVAKARAALKAMRDRTGLHATFLHLLIYAAAQAIHHRPRLNRFVIGKRLYQRRGLYVAFSAKKSKSDDAPIVLVKKKIDPAWSFEQLVRNIESGIKDGRSDKKSSTDKELGLLFMFPHFMVRALVWLIRTVDEWGLLPASMIHQDPMYASVFIANLGSIQMDAGYHHMYEYGTIPIFIVAGQAHPEVIPHGDTARTAERMPLKYSFDERIEDGLYCAKAIELVRELIEDPGRLLDASASVPHMQSKSPQP